jgi:hypothetical protein
MRRSRKKGDALRKGASVVLSAIIVAATTLTITMAALSFSNQVLNAQLDVSEYEQAKNMLLTLADMVEDVSASPLSAHYVHFNMRTSRPCFVPNTYSISVTVSGQATPVINGETGIVDVEGGPLVGTVNMITLLGNDCLIVNDVSKPLARVYEHQSNGAWITLDYSRVRVTNLGCFYYYDAGNGMSGYLNTVRIAFVNLTIGTTFGSESLDIIVRSLPTVLKTWVIPSNSVTVSVVLNGARTEQLTVVGLNTITCGGVQKPVIGTIIQVLNTEVLVTSQ